MIPGILILDTGKEWGGGTNSLLELLKRIDKDKYRITVLFYNNYKKGNDSDIKTEIEKLGIDFLLLGQKKQPAIAKALKELIRLIFFFSKKLKKYSVFFVDYRFRIKPNAERICKMLGELKIDLLYMNNQPSSNLEGTIASKITGIPALQHSRIETKLNSFEIGASNRWIKKMICVSEGVKNSFVCQGIDAGKCVTVHNGIDIGARPLTSPHEIRERWGISDNEIVIGTACSLIKRKRVNDLIEASAKLNDTFKIQNSKFKIIVVGEGPEKDNLRQQVLKMGLQDKIIFTGFQIDAISYINAMDIFVLPSEQEGMPRVILEAMLMAKPVVACDIAGPSELVVDGETGLLVTARNVPALADALLKLANSMDMRKAMGEKGRTRVVEKFSIEKYINDVEKVFAEVLEN